MSSVDEQRGTRYLLERNGQKLYLVIGDSWLMFFPPNEASLQHQEMYSAINAVCRLSSKLLAAGGDWATVVKHLRDANITSGRTLIADMVSIIRKDKGMDDARHAA